MRRTTALAVPALVLALAAAGCGSSSSGDSTGSSGGGYGMGAATTTKADTTTAGGAATIATADGELGVHLVDAQGRTLYLWEADTGTKSTCSGACAAAWPPALTAGAPTASGKAKAGDLGTTKRADGTVQVTYAGHPLYRFAGDTAPGQTNGEGSDGFGAEWYVVAPSGKAVDRT